jgi:hypothetical protein
MVKRAQIRSKIQLEGITVEFSDGSQRATPIQMKRLCVTLNVINPVIGRGSQANGLGRMDINHSRAMVSLIIRCYRCYYSTVTKH